MLHVISFLAPYPRLPSKQNADAISKGYQFMQQFTLPLKASLASEAKALERKFGRVLCYLAQLLQCSCITLPFVAGKGRLDSTQSTGRGQQPPPSAPVDPGDLLTQFVEVKAVVWG